MRLKHALLALCLAVLPVLARGQTPGTIQANRPLASSGSVNNINSQLGLKADATNPVVTGTLTLGGVAASGFGTGIGQVLGPLVNYQGSGLPGLNLSSRLILARLSPALNDFADVQVNRTTTFSGGSLTNINAAFRVVGSYGAGDATNNWNAVFQAVTVANAGGLTLGSFSTARRDPGGTSGVFGSITNAFDNTGLASAAGAQVVGQEVDVQVQKADTGANGTLFGNVGVRIGTNIVAIRANSADTAQTEVTTGLWFTTATLPLTSTNDAHTNFKSAIGFGINVQTQNALDTRGAIPPAGSSNPVAAVTMSAGHVIDFNGDAALNSNPVNYWMYDASTSKMKYFVGNAAKFSIDNSGNMKVNGTVTPSTTP